MNIHKNFYASLMISAVVLIGCAPLLASAQSVTVTSTLTPAEYATIESEINTLVMDIQSLENQLAQMNNSSCYTYSNDLALGSTGNDVNALQTLLINKGYLDISAPTGYFGTLTQAALEQYQIANGIAASSYGMVDATTMSLLNACAHPVTPVTVVTTTIPVTVPVTTTVNTNTTGMAPQITALSTSQAASGSIVSVFGNGFAPSGNTLTFTSILNATSTIVVPNLPSSGGGALSFTVPAVMNSIDPTSSTTCASESTCQRTGPYNVTLSNGSGTSNALSFGIE